MDLRAIALYHTGRIPEAAEAAREACRLEPSNRRLEGNAALLERLAQRSAGEEDPPFTGI